jgi:hypothetical protein
MGVVYKARDLKLKRVVALKVILVGVHAGESALIRFKGEAEAIARLQHPNIVQIYEVGEHEDKPFISLEFCTGGSLDAKIAGTPLPYKDAAQLVQQLAGAVHAAHQALVIHRDLKPANVLLTADGTPKITDFGLAKRLDDAGQTQSGAIMGTPSYMAPEQAEGKTKELGPATDIYSLGAILYELLTGRPPFKAATPLDTILQVVSDDLLPPRQLQKRIPPDLETICLKCLSKVPRHRYASAREVAEDLACFLEDEPIKARPPRLLTRCSRWARRRAVLVTVSCGLLGTSVFLMPLLAPLWPSVNESWQKALSQRHEHGKVIAEMNKILLEDAAHAGAHEQRGISLLALGEKDQAIAAFNCAIRLNPSSYAAYFHRGRVWSAKGNEQNALTDFDAALRLNSRYVEAYYERAAVRAKKGALDEAVADCTRALDLDPSHARAYHLRANLYQAKGMVEKADVDRGRAQRLGLPP